MKKLAICSLCLGCVFTAGTSRAIDLKQSKLTQVVNDVQIISAADQKQKNAAVNDTFAMPDILRTGNASRAELVAADQTVTRVGANTIFSFDPANRTIDLKQGSLLFHAPHGKGGGSIHTGSATASVLGTTLIVTTTPNGGFKVLALEGEVEVKFLNGLKQKLDPGHMTYVLPGANQLAPVIIFRLDELTANSLLVKGFQTPLDSTPLIQQQIDKQIKLIQSGKATDTGLYAGDNASPDQVEVLDLNTVSHGLQNPDLARAKGADAHINQSLLMDASIPTPPIHVFTSPFYVTGNSFLNGQVYSGFIARNIFVNEHGLDPLVVQLSSYSSLPVFDLVAIGDFSFLGSTTFKGLSSSADLALIAGGQFSFAPGITLEADVHDFKFLSPATMTLDGVSIYNYVNNVTLSSGGDINFENGSLVYANGKMTVNVAGSVHVGSSTLTCDGASISALSGSITLNNAELDTAHYAILIAPEISLDNSTINSESLTLSGSGSGAITINNSTLNASSALAIVGPTAVNITGSTLATDPAAGSVTVVSTFGSVNLSDTSITTHYLTLNSGDGILLDANGHTVAASGPGATARFTAPNLITVKNADLGSFAQVNMAANTIVLSDVALGAGSTDTFTSGNHALAANPNTDQPIVYGDTNFRHNVTYGGTLVTVPTGFVNGQIPGTGIIIQ